MRTGPLGSRSSRPPAMISMNTPAKSAYVSVVLTASSLDSPCTAADNCHLIKVCNSSWHFIHVYVSKFANYQIIATFEITVICNALLGTHWPAGLAYTGPIFKSSVPLLFWVIGAQQNDCFVWLLYIFEYSDVSLEIQKCI